MKAGPLLLVLLITFPLSILAQSGFPTSSGIKLGNTEPPGWQATQQNTFVRPGGRSIRGTQLAQIDMYAKQYRRGSTIVFVFETHPASARRLKY